MPLTLSRAGVRVRLQPRTRPRAGMHQSTGTPLAQRLAERHCRRPGIRPGGRDAELGKHSSRRLARCGHLDRRRSRPNALRAPVAHRRVDGSSAVASFSSSPGTARAWSGTRCRPELRRPSLARSQPGPSRWRRTGSRLVGERRFEVGRERRGDVRAPQCSDAGRFGPPGMTGTNSPDSASSSATAMRSPAPFAGSQSRPVWDSTVPQAVNQERPTSPSSAGSARPPRS